METSFIGRHALWSAGQQEAAQRVAAEIKDLGLRQVRISWGDQHGILRGKTLEVPHFLSVLKNGKDFQTATLIFDTTNNPVVAPFGASALGDPRMTGLPDAILVPDPTTFKILPWLDGTGWILSDLYYRSGERVPFDTRGVLQTQIDRLAEDGYQFVAGIEMEFYLTRLEDPKLSFEDSGYPPSPPTVSAVSHGFQYLTENRGDEIDGILRVLRDNVVALGLPLATVEDEWGPGQVEFTFEPMIGVAAADAAILVRSAIKQISRRHGYHATFMARPALANAFSSGWHLHQSLSSSDSPNAFAGSGDELLSETGVHFMGGLLEHALACSVLTTPTINGYKRFRPDSFAPDRVAWAEENRGALIRVAGARGDSSTHLDRPRPVGRRTVPGHRGVALASHSRGSAARVREEQSAPRRVRGPLRRLPEHDQTVRGRPFQRGSHRLGAARILRSVLRCPRLQPKTSYTSSPSTVWTTRVRAR
jgi:glutamine synthetase